MSTLTDIIAEEVTVTVAKTPSSFWDKHDLKLSYSLHDMDMRIKSVWTMIPSQAQRLSLLYRLAPLMASLMEERAMDTLGRNLYQVRSKLGFEDGGDWHNLQIYLVVTRRYNNDEALESPLVWNDD